MEIKRIPIKLKLGTNYIVYFHNNNPITCRFIQPTKCGFNFLNLKTSKCILKTHLYPSKCENHSSGDWFWINQFMFVREIY